MTAYVIQSPQTTWQTLFSCHLQYDEEPLAARFEANGCWLHYPDGSISSLSEGVSSAFSDNGLPVIFLLKDCTHGVMAIAESWNCIAPHMEPFIDRKAIIHKGTNGNLLVHNRQLLDLLRVAANVQVWQCEQHGSSAWVSRRDLEQPDMQYTGACAVEVLMNDTVVYPVRYQRAIEWLNGTRWYAYKP